MLNIFICNNKKKCGWLQMYETLHLKHIQLPNCPTSTFKYHQKKNNKENIWNAYLNVTLTSLIDPSL